MIVVSKIRKTSLRFAKGAIGNPLTIRFIHAICHLEPESKLWELKIKKVTVFAYCISSGKLKKLYNILKQNLYTSLEWKIIYLFSQFVLSFPMNELVITVKTRNFLSSMWSDKISEANYIAFMDNISMRYLVVSGK